MVDQIVHLSRVGLTRMTDGNPPKVEAAKSKPFFLELWFLSKAMYTRPFLAPPTPHGELCGWRSPHGSNNILRPPCPALALPWSETIGNAGANAPHRATAHARKKHVAGIRWRAARCTPSPEHTRILCSAPTSTRLDAWGPRTGWAFRFSDPSPALADPPRWFHSPCLASLAVAHPILIITAHTP